MLALQSVIVIVVVAGSITLSAWWLTPARRRLWVLNHLVSQDATRGPLVRLRQALLAQSQIGGCGACKANPNAPAKHSIGKGAGLPR
jgi:cytochrome c553